MTVTVTDGAQGADPEESDLAALRGWAGSCAQRSRQRLIFRPRDILVAQTVATSLGLSSEYWLSRVVHAKSAFDLGG